MKKTVAVLFVMFFVATAVFPFFTGDVSAADLQNVSGNIQDDQGNPIEGVTVTIVDHDESTTAIDGTSDLEGKFSIDVNNITANTKYKIKFEHADYSILTCPLLDLDNGWYDLGVLYSETSDIVVDTVMTLNIDVTGIVILDGGSPLEGVEVECIEEGGPVGSEQRATTNENGKFTIPDLDNNKVYLLTFTKSPYGVSNTFGLLTETSKGSGVWRLDLSEQHLPFTINVLMSSFYGSLTGTVTNEEGVNLSEVHVEISNAEGYRSATTTRNGVYTFNNVPIGTYTITITRSDIESQTKEVTVNRDGNTLDFVVNMKAHTYILGLDFPHSLMFVGALLGIIVILVVVTYRAHLGHKARMGESDKVFELDDDSDL